MFSGYLSPRTNAVNNLTIIRFFRIWQEGVFPQNKNDPGRQPDSKPDAPHANSLLSLRARRLMRNRGPSRRESASANISQLWRLRATLHTYRRLASTTRGPPARIQRRPRIEEKGHILEYSERGAPQGRLRCNGPYDIELRGWGRSPKARGMRINGQTGNPPCNPPQAAPRPPHSGRKLLGGQERGKRASGGADRARFGRSPMPAD